MYSNPVLETRTEVVKKIYPIKVVYVYKHPHNYNDVTFLTIRDFCEEIGIEFLCREYDSTKYKDDRDSIERLPSIHIYESNRREKTIYPNTRPFQHIEEVCNKVDLRNFEKQKSTELWKQRFQRIKSMFQRSSSNKLMKNGF